jgi:hypothetical protein
MTTDDLIEALSRDLDPAPKSLLARRVTLALVAGFVLGLLALRLTLGVRPDIGEAATTVAMKAGLGALIATLGLGLAAKAARPGAGPGKAAPLMALAAAALGVAATALWTTDAGHRMEAWTGGGFPWCVALIPAFGAPTALGLLWALREAAPTRLALAGAAVGAVAGGAGALIYALYCPIDSIAFVTTWYVAGVAVSSALGAILGVRLLRW